MINRTALFKFKVGLHSSNRITFKKIKPYYSHTKTPERLTAKRLSLKSLLSGKIDPYTYFDARKSGMICSVLQV